MGGCGQGVLGGAFVVREGLQCIGCATAATVATTRRACTKTLSLYLSMKPCTRRLLGGRAQGVDTGKSLDARRRGEGGD